MTESMGPESRPPGLRSLEKSLSLLWLSFSIWQMPIQIITIHSLGSCCDDWMSSYIIKVTYHCFILWELKSPSCQPWLWSGLLKNLSIIIHIQCVWGKCLFECWKEPWFPVIMGWLQSNQNVMLKLATPATWKTTETPSFIWGARVKIYIHAQKSWK